MVSLALCLLLLLNFKERGGVSGVGWGAGLPPLDNALPYRGRLLSGFLSQALLQTTNRVWKMRMLKNENAGK